MSLPSRDYYIKSPTHDGDKFIGIKDGQIKFVNDFRMGKAFNFHSYDQAETFIEYLEVTEDYRDLEVYRY
jgi:hypothetical protein